MNSLVTAHELFDQMEAGNRAFRLVNSNIDSDQTVLRGKFTKTNIRAGLSIHYSDITNLCDFKTETEAPPHLGIKLFFQGGVAASIGDQNIPMPRYLRGRWIPSATLFHQKEKELFRRHAAPGDRVRKLTVKILPGWLESGDVFADASAIGLRDFMSGKLSSRSWVPSPSLLALADQTISPPVLEPHLHRLYVESRVLGIIGEAFALLVEGKTTADARGNLSAIERRRLLRAEEFLRSTPDFLSVDEIAAKTGVSVNTLQRLFHAAYGTTVFHYVRRQKLEQARVALENEGLTIAQAAYVAGYNSPANFSTAFKRQYGFTPKKARG